MTTNYRSVYSKSRIPVANGRASFDVSAGASGVLDSDTDRPVTDAVICVGAGGIHVQCSATPAELREIGRSMLACAEAIEADAARPTVTLINPLSQEKPLTIDVVAVGGAR